MKMFIYGIWWHYFKYKTIYSAFKWRHDLTFEEVDSIQNACGEFLSVLGLKRSDLTQEILNSHRSHTLNSVPTALNP